jgi:ATP-dependent Lhr-like helicase
VFLSPPLFAVLHGRQELGFVDELTFLGKQQGGRVLLLGGRAWHVTHVDWQRKVAHVEASDDRGRSRWKGEGRGLSFRLCQAIKGVLAEDQTRPWWSQRARTQLEEVRSRFPWLTPESTVIVANRDNGMAWWTFAGRNANMAIGPAVANRVQVPTTSDNLMIEFERALPLDDVERAIMELRSCDQDELLPAVDPQALEGLKFSDCLPQRLGMHVLAVRTRDPAAVEHVLETRVRLVSN